MVPIEMLTILGIFDSLNPFSSVSAITQEINLVIFGFKIVIMLFIISFVRSRFGGGKIVTLITLGLVYILLFTNYFALFGPMMFIYMFLIFGFTTIVFDMSIAKPWKKMDLGGMQQGHMPDANEEYNRMYRKAM